MLGNVVGFIALLYSTSESVPGSTREDRETRQDITVGLSLSLILFLLLAALAPLLFYFAWRRHIQQRYVAIMIVYVPV